MSLHSLSRLGASRRGTTLPELLLALVLIAVLGGLALPLSRQVMDRVRVVAARESIVGLCHRARGVARRHGGARITVDQRDESITLTDRFGRRIAGLKLHESGVDLSTTGSTDRVQMVWNALGWGVVASRTLILRKGEAEARVVVSSRGRVSRR